MNDLLAKNSNVKSVIPLLSTEMIQKSMKILVDEKYYSLSNFEKLPLRKIWKKFRIDNFVLKQKLGFSVSIETFWKNHGLSMAKEYLVDGKTIQYGWIKKNWVQSNLNNQNIDIRHIDKLLELLSFEIWYKDVIKN